VVDKRFFQGLPSPGSGGAGAGFIWLMTELASRGRLVAWVDVRHWRCTPGLTMVTNVPFYSFKDIGAEASVPFAVIVLVALGIALISIDPPKACCSGCSAPMAVGLCGLCWRKFKGSRPASSATSTDEPDERGLHRGACASPDAC
jgi:CDP-diacylglycerol--serine O-phosphatidyltransferase